MTEVIRYDFELPVKIRKHVVNLDGLRTLLRSCKKASGLTNRQLAEKLGRPITEVEHWFRTDKHFSIPDPTLWHELKELIGIATDEYDAQVTEFEERPGVFEKANRFYDSQGIAPTITSSSADEKIIVDERKTKGDGHMAAEDGCILLGRINATGHDSRKRVYSIEGVSPTPSGLGMGGNTEPKVAVPSDLTGRINERKTKGDDAMRKVKSFKTAPFRYASLFSGIGGFDLAFNGLGGTCVLASEIDKYAELGYQTIYGHATAGDVTKINEKDVPDHELLVAGFPCQSFSVAGKRGGFDDARGTMFFEVARIATEKKPRVLLLENVKGLVSHDKGKTLDTIVKTLNDIGYRVDFDILNSKFFGVPQNRERIFIVGVREDLVDNQPWANMKGSTIIPKGKRRLAEYPDLKSFNFDWPSQDEVSLKLLDILEPTVDERFYLSDEKTAELVAKLDERDKVDGTIGHHPFSKKKEFSGYHSDVSPCLIATDYKAPKTVLEGEESVKLPAEPPFCVHNIYGGFNEGKPRVFEGESPTIRTSAGGGHLPSVLEEVNGLPIREATQKGYAVAEEGDVVNYKFPSSKTRRGRVGKQIAHTVEASAFSQGVVEREPTVKSIGNTNPSGKGMGGTVYDIDAGLSPTVTCNKGEGSRITQGPQYRIRKLTPLECFRLQGFPDEVHQALVDAGISDSQRYKMAGNAVTVNVIEAIGERLLPLITDQQA